MWRQTLGVGIPRSMALRAPFRAPFVSRKGRKRMGLPLSWVPAFAGMTGVLQWSQHRGTGQAPGFPGCRGRFETCPYGVIVSLGMGRASPAISLRLLASPCASRRGLVRNRLCRVFSTIPDGRPGRDRRVCRLRRRFRARFPLSDAPEGARV